MAHNSVVTDIPKFFTKDMLKADVQRALATLESRLVHLTYGWGWEKNPDLREKQWHVDSVQTAYITHVYAALYDYAFSAEWDWSANGHIFDAYQDAQEFVNYTRQAHEFDPDADQRLNFVSAVSCARGKFDSIMDTNIGIDESITLDDVRLLANMSLASVRNAISRGELKSYHEDDGHQYIDDESLREWLPKRKAFKPTTFKGKLTDNKVHQWFAESNKPTLTVPIASDGSPFHPGLKRQKGYQIGAKGEEQYVENFEEALEALKAMQPPYWRRPNSNGIYGIVRGIGWKEFTEDELYNIQ